MFSLFSYLQNISQIKEKLKHSCLKLSALWVFEFRHYSWNRMKVVHNRGLRLTFASSTSLNTH